MRKRIFFAILISSVITAAAGLLSVILLVFNDVYDPAEHLDGILLIAAILLLLSVIVALVSASRTVEPINKLDPAHPDPRNCPEELVPLMKQLKEQSGVLTRKKTELSSSREQFSIITETMKEGIAIADPKSMILSCNSAACRLMGVEPLTAGQSIYALSNEERFRRCILDAMGGRQSECLIKTENGERKIIASPAAVSEVINGIVIFILDVTEEQALEKMRREFTSNVSHELKTPLTTIYGISDMLANGMVKPEDVQSFGGDIRSEAERLISLINDIVSLSKLDESDLPRQDEEVDLYELAEEVIGRLKTTAKERNITGELSGTHVSVNGDRTVLEEVIYNLCDNAIKYNRDGGSYIVRISHVPMKAIITVTDTGIGIPDEHIDRIFERFYRADKSRSKKIKGTGLGLSIVKHGVSYHNGTVRVTSSDEGTVFIVELPIEKNS